MHSSNVQSLPQNPLEWAPSGIPKFATLLTCYQCSNPQHAYGPQKIPNVLISQIKAMNMLDHAQRRMSRFIFKKIHLSCLPHVNQDRLFHQSPFSEHRTGGSTASAWKTWLFLWTRKVKCDWSVSKSKSAKHLWQESSGLAETAKLQNDSIGGAGNADIQVLLKCLLSKEIVLFIIAPGTVWWPNRMSRRLSWESQGDCSELSRGISELGLRHLCPLHGGQCEFDSENCENW